MTEHPTPEEAARALQEVKQRKDQSLDSSVREKWWVRILMGAVVFVFIAAPDFLGRDARSWVSTGVAVVMVAYVLMIRSRRGSAVLGRPARARMDGLSNRYLVAVSLVLLAVVVIGVGLAFVPPGQLPTIPYLHTGIGAVAGIGCVVFGPSAERALRAFARRDPAEGAMGDGSR